jgi:hypothetical protein
LDGSPSSSVNLEAKRQRCEAEELIPLILSMYLNVLIDSLKFTSAG